MKRYIEDIILTIMITVLIMVYSRGGIQWSIF